MIETLDLVEDLRKWTNLYVAGRLHKPIRVIRGPDPKSSKCELLKDAMEANYRRALCVALMLLPKTFTEEQLYETIAGLSYFGDFRMIVGEDRNKIADIVSSQLHAFRCMYLPRLVQMMREYQWDVKVDPERRSFTIREHLKPPFCIGLPDTILEYIENAKSETWSLSDMFTHPEAQKLTQGALTSIVRYSSVSQGIKGWCARCDSISS